LAVVCELFERKVRNVWSWAGQYRRTGKNNSESRVDVTETRTGQIKVLRAADGHEYGPLIAFLRS
jgi:hypothetical protein